MAYWFCFPPNNEVILIHWIVFTLIQTEGPIDEVATAGSTKAAEDAAATDADVHAVL